MKYRVRELFFTWSHQMVVEDNDGNEYGRVLSHPFSFHSKRTWEYPLGSTGVGSFIAESHRDLISLIIRVYVEDCHGKMLGEIQELYRHHKSAITEFVVKDNSGNQLARSQLVSNFGTEVDVIDNQGRQVAQMTKSWIQVVDSWEVSIDNSTHTLANDPRLVVLLLANNSASGYWGFGQLPVLAFGAGLVVLIVTCVVSCKRRASLTRSVAPYQSVGTSDLV